jgi:hypothetical protein
VQEFRHVAAFHQHGQAHPIILNLNGAPILI